MLAGLYGGRPYGTVRAMPAQPVVPSVVGPFLPKSFLAHAEVAELFLAERQGAAGAPPVVLRVFNPTRGLDAATRALLQADLTAAAQLRHLGIAQVVGLGEADGRFFVASELPPGKPVSEFIGPEAERLPPWRIARLGVEVAQALAHAHGKNPPVLHRDLNPENVFFDADDRVRVAEFGVSRAAAQLLRNERVGLVMTPRYTYRSPEVMTGAATIDGRADVFSLCVMLWELVAGTRLHPKPDFMGIMSVRGQSFPPDCRSHNPSAPAPLVQAILSGLSLDPASRPTALEFAAKLALLTEAPEPRVPARPAARVASAPGTLAPAAPAASAPSGGLALEFLSVDELKAEEHKALEPQQEEAWRPPPVSRSWQPLKEPEPESRAPFWRMVAIGAGVVLVAVVGVVLFKSVGPSKSGDEVASGEGGEGGTGKVKPAPVERGTMDTRGGVKLQDDPANPGQLIIVNTFSTKRITVGLNPVSVGLPPTARASTVAVGYDAKRPESLTLTDGSSGKLKTVYVSPAVLGYPEGLDAEIIATKAHNQGVAGAVRDVTGAFGLNSNTKTQASGQAEEASKAVEASTDSADKVGSE